jgi:hypothetical protein
VPPRSIQNHSPPQFQPWSLSLTNPSTHQTLGPRLTTPCCSPPPIPRRLRRHITIVPPQSILSRPRPRRPSPAHPSTRQTLGHHLTASCRRPLPHDSTLGAPRHHRVASVHSHSPFLDVHPQPIRRHARPSDAVQWPPAAVLCLMARRYKYHVTIAPPQSITTPHFHNLGISPSPIHRLGGPSDSVRRLPTTVLLPSLDDCTASLHSEPPPFRDISPSPSVVTPDLRTRVDTPTAVLSPIT